MTYPAMSTDVKWALTKSGFHKGPQFQSLTQPTAGGRGRSSISLQPYATWTFEVELPPTPGPILQKFLGCFLATNGGAGFFLFTDPNDNTVDVTTGIMLNVTPGAATPMGQVGDGTSTQFLLARTIDIGVEVLQNVTGVVAKVNGVTASATVSDTGVVTFAVAPASGAVLTWAGSFQYLCQFTDDTLKDLAAVNKNGGGLLWTCGSIAFESVLL